MVNNNGSRRVRTSALTRGEIAAAALRMFAEDGLAGLSMRRLGSELGVHYSTLYWHISDKRELLRLVLDAVLADVPAPPPEADSCTGLAELFSGLRTALRAHPGAAVLVLESSTPGPNGTAFARSAQRLLAAAGLDAQHAGWAYRTLIQYTAASVQQESAQQWSAIGRFAGAGEVRHRVRLPAAAVPAPRAPHHDTEPGTGTVVEGRADEQATAEADAQFGYGLTCLLHGIAAAV